MATIISTISFWTLFLATTASASLPTPVPGEIRNYKDWSVGCDNGGNCQAVSLVNDVAGGGFDSWGGPVVVTRTPDTDDNLKIRVLFQNDHIDRYQMLVDGRLIDTGPLVEGDYPIEIVGKDAVKVSQAIIKGNNLQVIGPNGENLTTVSLSGSAAALRYMDVQQKRAYTRTALVSKGRRKFRPLKSEIPTIVIDQWAPANRIPATIEIVDLIENSVCKDERFGVVEDQIYPMGQKGDRYRALVLISCGSGAYNVSSTAYIGEIKGDEKDGATWAFRPATYDLQPGWGAKGRPPLLVNPDWDEEHQILSSYAKGRGLGDCGSAERYIWDGQLFRLIEASAMRECRGAYEWITIWRAKYQNGKELAQQSPASDNIVE
ncbi:DUF1176 domain-containing protein [Parasphingorhabdus sp. JC815]|uniref:DUF1176 domain-containing protein n=1 Tax=Parasphingorhabdus sp. JC815 TaxID=3232140 RepID=UPI00345B1469